MPFLDMVFATLFYPYMQNFHSLELKHCFGKLRLFFAFDASICMINPIEGVAF
jgi:hypothetical protein